MRRTLLLLATLLLLFNSSIALAQDEATQAPPQLTAETVLDGSEEIVIEPTPTDAVIDDEPINDGTINDGTTPSTTATPTEEISQRPNVAEFILDWEDEVLYPQGLYFYLWLNVPIEQINSVRLLMNIEGENTPRVINDEEIRPYLTEQDNRATAKLIWAFPLNNPPPLQARINYEWRIELTDTRTASVPGLINFQNPAGSWINERLNNNLQAVYPSTAPNTFSQRLSDQYDLLAQNMGIRPQFNVILSPNTLPIDPCQVQDEIRIDEFIALSCDESLIDVILSDISYTRITGLNINDTISRTIHSLTDLFYMDTWDGQDVPDWFKTGIHAIYQSSSYQGELQITRQQQRVDRLLELDALNTITDDDLIAQAQGVMMTLYLADHFGLETVYDLASSEFIEEETFAERYQRITDSPIERVIPAMSNWLYYAHISDIVEFNLYIEPTSTPTITLTATAFPSTITPTPTPTYTATPTATITPTPTLTGTLTVTPLPSLTPSLTPTPQPPTITPLPADYVFPTVAPALVPPPPPAEPITQELLLLTLAGFIILAAFGGIMLLFRNND